MRNSCSWPAIGAAPRPAAMSEQGSRANSRPPGRRTRQASRSAATRRGVVERRDEEDGVERFGRERSASMSPTTLSGSEGSSPRWRTSTR